MTDENATTVNLISDGPIPAKQVVVMHSLQRLGQIVPTSQWCLIGGLMVELLLISRGGMMLRPTDDGDIVGDVVADRAVLRNVIPTRPNKRMLEAPGTDLALETATEYSVVYAADEPPFHHPHPVRARRSLRESVRLAHDQERTRPEQASARRRRAPDNRPSPRTPQRVERCQKTARVVAWRTHRPELNRLAVRDCTAAHRRNREAVDCARDRLIDHA